MKSVRTTRHCARRRPSISFVAALAALLSAFSLPAAANGFVVDTGTDGPQDPSNTTTCAELVSPGSTMTTGHCSLRAAIMLGNNITGPHTITFNPTVPMVTVVNGNLDQMRAQFAITGNLPVRTIINGNGHGCLDLTDSGTERTSPAPPIHNGNGANGSMISNLSIGNCSGAGISANGHGYTFSNNYIGVDPTGLVATANSGDGIVLSASFAYQSQFIDTGALQTLNNSLPAQPVTNTDISSFSVNLATALQNLQPNKILNNVISGNALNGVYLHSVNLGAVFVSANFIGTDLTGNKAIPNGDSGIRLSGDTFANLINGNTISGNTNYGIRAEAASVYMPNFIMGNRIGLATVAGNHVGNGLSGIYVDTNPDTSVGNFNPSSTSLIVGPLNVIADNQGANNNTFPDVLGSDNAGIVITGASTGVKVLGNTIGIAEFPAGTPNASKAYGNLGDGIIVTTSGNQIGSAGQGNVIAANARHGIVVSGSATTGNSFLGNSIGVHPGLAGNLALGNGVDGIHIDAASSTTMGGPGATDFNTVAANGRNGIKIVNGGSAGNTGNGWANLSQRNLIYHNATAPTPVPAGAFPGVGFDLDRAQNTTNPLITAPTEIPANYTNLDQAQPVVCAGPGDSGACAGSTAPSSVGGSTTLQWTIATHGVASFRMEFFAVDNADPNLATHMTFLGEQAITTDANGVPNSASCNAGRCSTTLQANTGGSYVLMNATDVTALANTPAGGTDWKANLTCFVGTFGIPTSLISACTANNTSEFSNTVNVPQAPPSATTTAATAITTTGATFNGTVNDNGATTTVSFEYGLDTSYGTPAAATPSSVAAGAGNTAVSATPAAALTCGTTYHFRVDASTGVASSGWMRAKSSAASRSRASRGMPKSSLTPPLT